MRKSFFGFAVAVWATLLVGNTKSEEVAAISFRGQIAPLLNDYCLACHCSKRSEGGYRVDTIEKLFTPGDSSEQPIAPESENLGEVFARLVAEDVDVRMPAEHPAFSAEQIAIVKAWLTQGAKLDSEEKTAPLWTIIPPQTYKAPPEKYPQTIPITAVQFGDDGSSIMASGYHEVTQWRIEDSALIRRIPNQPQRINDLVSIGATGKLLVAGGTAGKMGEVRSSLLESGDLESVLAKASEFTLAIALRPNSNEVAIAGGDSSIKLVDYTTGELKQTFFSHADWVTGVAFSADGSKMASSSLDKSCKVYDLTSGEVVASYSKHNAAVRGIAGIDDGTEWISIGANNQLHRWKTDGTATVFSVPLSGEPLQISLAQDSAIVIQGNKHWSQISLSEKKVVRSTPMESMPLSMDLHGESGRVAIGSLNGTVSVWNLSDGGKVKEFVALPR